MILDLDCSNVDTTFDCVTRLIGIDREELESKFRNGNERDWPGLHYEEYLLQIVFGDSRYQLPEPELAYWFHSTRILKTTTFDEGLKPTSEIREDLVRSLATLAEEMSLCSLEEFGKLPMTGNGAQRLAAKHSNGARDDGPHGFLIRETIPDTYFRAPEFVKEYCEAIPFEIGSPLADEYSNRTFPAVVKFSSTFQLRRILLTAMYYLHQATTRPNDFSDYTVHGIGGERHVVSRDDIVSIEFVNQTK